MFRVNLLDNLKLFFFLRICYLFEQSLLSTGKIEIKLRLAIIAQKSDVGNKVLRLH